MTSNISATKIANIAEFYIAAAMTSIARFTKLSEKFVLKNSATSVTIKYQKQIERRI